MLISVGIQNDPPSPRTPRSLRIVDMGSEGLFIGADSNDPGVKVSSPASKASRRKREAKRKVTIAAQNAQRAQAHEERLLGDVQAQIEAHLLDEVASTEAKTQCFHEVLEHLGKNKVTWGDFVEWISRPTSGMAQERFDGLFKNRDRASGSSDSQVRRILDLWSTRNSRTGRADVNAWAVQYVGRIVSQEANAVARDGVLLTRRKSFTGEFLLSFSFSSIHQRIRKLCPSMSIILYSFSTTTRQRKANNLPNQSAREEARTAKRQARKDRVWKYLPDNVIAH